MRRLFIGTLVLLLGTATENVLASGKANGSVVITLQTKVGAQKTPRPAYFPHDVHQAMLACSTCHHGQDADGKQIPYAEEQKITECEACHNDKSGLPSGLSNLKNIGHKLCIECHLENDLALGKCSACHRKK